MCDVELKCRIIGKTEDGLQVKTLPEDGESTFWVPRSCVGVVEEPDGVITLVLSEWLARQNGVY